MTWKTNTELTHIFSSILFLSIFYKRTTITELESVDLKEEVGDVMERQNYNIDLRVKCVVSQLKAVFLNKHLKPVCTSNEIKNTAGEAKSWRSTKWAEAPVWYRSWGSSGDNKET